MLNRLIQSARPSGTSTMSRMMRAAGATKAAATHDSDHCFRWRARRGPAAMAWLTAQARQPESLAEFWKLGSHLVERLLRRLGALQRLLDGDLQRARQLGVVR